jgi:hypothetical protein
MLNDAFRKELLKFDAERVLFAWDGLLRKQQATLESCSAPPSVPSASSTVSQRQTTDFFNDKEPNGPYPDFFSPLAILTVAPDDRKILLS